MFEIYFSDLTPEAQERFLASCGLSSAAEGNYDVFPIKQISPPQKWTGRAPEEVKMGPAMRRLCETLMQLYYLLVTIGA